jgi:hypothetical protein
MSTEQQPTPTTPTHNQPKAEPNALAQSLSGGWEKFKSGQLIGYKWMALILVAVAGIGTTWWIVHEKRKGESAKWVELDALSSPTALDEFARKYPNTKQAKIAELDIARTQLEPEGIERLTSERPEIRKAAIESVEKARDSFAKLADDFKGDPVLNVVCLMARAKAEASLVGLLKDGTLDQYYGDPAKALEALDKVVEAAPDTDWGKDAKKLADDLRNMNTKQQVVELQRSVYLMPTLAPTGPKMPFDPTGKLPKDDIHGGLGGGFGPP